eukprot:SAG11_NODE_3954_length_2134_cov_1.565602_2_plen_365_part_00
MSPRLTAARHAPAGILMVKMLSVLLLLACPVATGLGSRTSLEDRHSRHSWRRLRHHQRPQRAQKRFFVDRDDMAAPSPPAGRDWIDITSYNVSTDGSYDVSAVIEAIGRANTHGATLFFPGRLGGGGAAAGWLPSKYLIDPPKLLRGLKAWNSPAALTLWIEPGAALVTAAGVRMYIGGAVQAGATHIFDPHTHPLPAQIRSNGTNATVTVNAGMGLVTGDRFRVSGANQPQFNGYWCVFSHSSGDHGDSFSYQLAQPPDNTSVIAEAGGAPQITFAGFYFGAQKPSKSLVGDGNSPNAWVSPEWWGVAAQDTGADDTLGVQFALDAGFPIRFLQSYNVARVTIGGGTILDGQVRADNWHIWRP